MKKKVVFLDRDGVINIERGDYTWKEEDLAWVPQLFESLSLLNDNDFDLIVISNQGGISKGVYTKNDVLNIDRLFRAELKKHSIKLLDSFYCPHHSEQEACLCRKPKSLMLEKAVAKHNVNANLSFFIGDSDRDINAGQKVGIKGLKVVANDSILEMCKNLIHG